MNQKTNRPLEGQRRDIGLDGLNVVAREWGHPGTRRVLALHGWLDNAASFDTLAPLLQDVHLVAMDLPGHGHSQHLATGASYHFIDGVAHVRAVTKAMDWDHFTLMGHSMGAGIATLFAGTYPEIVDELILLEGLGPLAQEPQDAPVRLAKSMASESRMFKNGPRLFDDLNHAIDARARGTDLDRQTTEILVRRGTKETPQGKVVFRHDPRLKIPSRFRMTEDVVTAFLRAIKNRVLVIWAHDGWPFPRQALEAREKKISQLTSVWVDGGHHVHLTHPDRVAPAINEFLQASSIS